MSDRLTVVEKVSGKEGRRGREMKVKGRVKERRLGGGREKQRADFQSDLYPDLNGMCYSP